MLTSAMLGTKTQLPSLVSLTLSDNAISTLKKDDFYFLSRSPSLRVLNMLRLPLKKVLKTGSKMSLVYISVSLLLTGCASFL